MRLITGASFAVQATPRPLYSCRLAQHSEPEYSRSALLKQCGTSCRRPLRLSRRLLLAWQKCMSAVVEKLFCVSASFCMCKALLAPCCAGNNSSQ